MNIIVIALVIFCIVVAYLLYSILTMGIYNQKTDTTKIVSITEFTSQLNAYLTKSTSIPTDISSYMDPIIYKKSSIGNYVTNDYFNTYLTPYITYDDYTILTSKFLTNDDTRSLKSMMYIYDSTKDKPDESKYGFILKTYLDSHLEDLSSFSSKIKDFILGTETKYGNIFNKSTKYLNEIITSSNKTNILGKFLTTEQYNQKIGDYIKKDDGRVNTNLYLTKDEYRFDKSLYVLQDDIANFDRSSYLDATHANNVLNNLIKDYYKISIIERSNSDSISFNNAKKESLVTFNKNTVKGKDIRNVIFEPKVEIYGSFIKM